MGFNVKLLGYFVCNFLQFCIRTEKKCHDEEALQEQRSKSSVLTDIKGVWGCLWTINGTTWLQLKPCDGVLVYSTCRCVFHIFFFYCHSFSLSLSLASTLLAPSTSPIPLHSTPLLLFIHSHLPFILFHHSPFPLSLRLYFVLFSFLTQCTLYKVGSCFVVMLCPMKVNDLMCCIGELFVIIIINIIFFFLPSSLSFSVSLVVVMKTLDETHHYMYCQFSSVVFSILLLLLLLL